VPPTEAAVIAFEQTSPIDDHTVRFLQVDPAPGQHTLAMGAALRVTAPWLPFDYLLLIRIAGTLWGGAFLLFLALYGPKLLGPRPDDRP